MKTTSLNKEFQLMNVNELMTYCEEMGVELTGAFAGEDIEYSFDFDKDFDEKKKKEVADAIGNYQWISTENIMVDQKRYRNESIVHFIDHGFYLKQIVYHVWGDPVEWKYNEVIPEERKVIFYVEKK